MHDENLPRRENILAVGSNRDRALFCGFLPTSLRMTRNYRWEFIKDIFGCDKDNQRGLIDSKDEEEFRCLLVNLQNRWERREISARSTESVSFYSWFARYPSLDMHEKAILSVRQKVGLGDDFFYNNDIEISHNVLKTIVQPKTVRLANFC